jgi:hypothetical protein
VIGVFLFVQLGSQVLSGWFLLRRPASFYDRTLPRSTGVLSVISYGLQLAWLVVIAVDLTNPLGLAFAIALIGVSTMVALTLLGTKATQPTADRTPVSTLALGRGASAALRCYLAAAAIAGGLWLVGKLLPVVVSDGSSYNGASLGFTISAISLIVVVLLGLPWSHTLLGIAITVLFLPLAGDQVNTGGIEQWLDGVLLLSVLANAAFAIIILRSETRRVRLVNGFFRLTVTTPATTTGTATGAGIGAGAGTGATTDTESA